MKLKNTIFLSCQENKNIISRHLVSTFESRIHPLRIKTISDVSFLILNMNCFGGVVLLMLEDLAFRKFILRRMARS